MCQPIPLKWLEQTIEDVIFQPIHHFHCLSTQIETCVRSLLPTYLRTTCTNSDKAKFQENVLKKVLENEELQFCWPLLSRDISNVEDSEQLLSGIVQLWITIRGFSIVATWMEDRSKEKHPKVNTNSSQSQNDQIYNYTKIMQWNFKVQQLNHENL